MSRNGCLATLPTNGFLVKLALGNSTSQYCAVWHSLVLKELSEPPPEMWAANHQHEDNKTEFLPSRGTEIQSDKIVSYPKSDNCQRYAIFYLI